MTAAASERVAPFRALVVDDIPEICGLYQSVFGRLRHLPIDLVLETDPLAAIARIREMGFDLVVSDFRMKAADGVDVLSAARAARPEGRRVLMTGYNEIPTGIARIRLAAIDAYVKKPLRVQELIILINDLLVADPSILAAYRERAAELERAGGNDGVEIVASKGAS